MRIASNRVALNERTDPIRARVAARWGTESIAVTLLFAVVLLVMTVRAFGSFFLAEDFVYLGSLYAQGHEFWRAAFSPMGGIFFRPVFFITTVPWLFVLPHDDPIWFHVRNFALSVVCLFLLYRILVRLVSRKSARIVALALFAVSKIHFQTIGFVGVFEAVVMLALLLATVLFFLRFIETRSKLDYVLAMTFAALSVFSKDYGLVVIVLVPTLVFAYGHAPDRRPMGLRGWVPRLAPLPVLALANLVARYISVGPLPAPAADTPYSPQVIPTELAYKLVVFAATIGNVAFGSDGTTGNGLAPTLVRFAPALGSSAAAVDIALFAALLGLLAFTVWRVRRRIRRIMVLPLVWIGAYLAPTLLVRNEQLYYLYLPLAGVALLLGMCLDNATAAGLRRAWTVAVVVIGALGWLSNSTSLYTWQFAANGSAQLRQPVLEAQRGKPLDSLTFVTDSRALWRWTLMADGLGPMLPYLLDRPDLKVEVLDYFEAGTRTFTIDDRNPVYDIDNGFQAYDPYRMQAPLTLRGISPTQAIAGQHFNVQPDGESAIAASAEGATQATVIVIDGRRLPTSFASTTYLAALVPNELLAVPGVYQVYLTDGITESNHLPLVVESAPVAQ